MKIQPTQIKTGVVCGRASAIMAGLLTVALVFVAALLLQYEPQYKPPPFEQGAVQGIPEPPENFNYGRIDATDNFAVYISGAMYQQEDGSLKPYFTNPEENEAYLMCEVVDADGKTLYKSGLLRPGEYVESLSPVKRLKNEPMDIEVKIYAFEMEQFYSLGTLDLVNTLQPF